MTAQEKLLAYFSKLIPIGEQEQTYINNAFELMSFAKKEFLLKKGEVSGNEYFIVKGCIRAYITDEQGKEHTISFGIENWWCGDLKSFLLDTPADNQIQAIEDTQALAINRDNWKLLFYQIPLMEKAFRQIFQKAIIARHDRLIQNISLSAHDRYQGFLEKYPEFILRIPQKHIASYLGITPEFLSTIRSKKP